MKCDHPTYRTRLCKNLPEQTLSDSEMRILSHASEVQMVKCLSVMRETWVQSLGQEDPPGEGGGNHSSILAWRIPWTEEPGRLQSMGSQRVRHAWATSLSLLPDPSAGRCYTFAQSGSSNSPWKSGSNWTKGKPGMPILSQTVCPTDHSVGNYLLYSPPYTHTHRHTHSRCGHSTRSSFIRRPVLTARLRSRGRGQGRGSYASSKT